MRLLLQNGAASPLDVVVQQDDVRRAVAPGDELAVEWTWSGFADLTFATGWIALSVPAGHITVADPVPADQELWNVPSVPGGTGAHEFWIHNANGGPLNTFWEPWCGEAAIPARGGPMRVEWTASSLGACIIYEPDLVTVWDCCGSFRAWQPDGEEVFTGGMYPLDPDGKHAPHPVPGWPR